MTLQYQVKQAAIIPPYVSTVSIYTVYQTLVTTQGTGDMGLVCKLGQQRRSDVTVTEREEAEMVGNTK